MAQRATPIPIVDDPQDPKVHIDANGNVTGGGTLNNGGVLKYRSQTSRSVLSIGGTTEEITMPLTSATFKPSMANRLRKSTPYSSTVCDLLVVTRQWATIDPHVEPFDVSYGSDGDILVEVHQVVRDLNGNVLADQRVLHVFRIEGGLVKRFDIGSA